MKTKDAIITWLIGFILISICGLFYLMQKPLAGINLITIFAFLLVIIGFFTFVYKCFKYSNRKDFFNLTKYAIIIWLSGLIISIICSLFGIMHWPFYGLTTIISMFGNLLRIIGFILFVYKFYKFPDKKDFLNS